MSTESSHAVASSLTRLFCTEISESLSLEKSCAATSVVKLIKITAKMAAENFARSMPDVPLKAIVNAPAHTLPTWGGEVAALLEDMSLIHILPLLEAIAALRTNLQIYLRGFLIAACAAARRAMGTRDVYKRQVEERKTALAKVEPFQEADFTAMYRIMGDRPMKIGRAHV